MKSEMKSNSTETVTFARRCRNILDEKKVIRSVIMDVRGISSYFDYFIIATCNSYIHNRSVALELQRFVKKSGMKLRNRPDLNSGWIVLDYSEIVIHLFIQEMYEFYQLEKLWSDAEYID